MVVQNLSHDKMKFDKNTIYKLVVVKIAVILAIIIFLVPFVPVETQIQCITIPCDPIIEFKSIIQILIKN